MSITAFRGMKPGSQFIFALFIILVSVLVLFVVSIIVALPFVGVSEMFDSFSGNNLSSSSALAILKYFQVSQSIGMFVLPPFIIAYLYEGNVFNYLNLKKPLQLNTIFIGLLAVLVSMPLVNFIGEFNENIQLPEFLAGFERWMRNMEDNAAGLIERFIQVESIWGLLFNLFMIAVIPAIGEELLFRGVIQKIFTTMTRNFHWGIWISAILFSALHMQFYGFLPRTVLGALFGYLLVYSGSIWLPIIAHFLNNTIGVLLLHAENNGNSNMTALNEYTESFSISWVVALVSLLVVVLLLRTLNKKNESLLSSS